MSLVALIGMALLPILPARGIQTPSTLGAGVTGKEGAALIQSRRVKVTTEKSVRPAELPETRIPASSPADAPKPAPTDPKAQPLQAPPKPSDARELPVPPAQAPTDATTDVWSEAEIKDGLTECAKLLAQVQVEVQPLPPVRSGACGTPAPIALKAIGSSGKVALTPAATVNCRMAVMMAGWVESTLQPAAREAFGQAVTGILTASSYSCRNRYGQSKAPISEHAFANAVDISGFVLGDGRVVKVASGWGATARDAKPASQNDKSAATTQSKQAPLKVAGLKGSASHKLGVPIAAASPAPSQDQKSEGSAEPEFLRKLHRGACKRFGTVLGPEANEAHRDHLHFDLKARSHGSLCE